MTQCVDLTVTTTDGIIHGWTIIDDMQPQGARPAAVDAHTVAHMLELLPVHARVATISINLHTNPRTNPRKEHK